MSPSESATPVAAPKDGGTSPARGARSVPDRHVARPFSDLDGLLLKLARLLAWAGAAALAALLLLICANIALRPLDGGLRGSAELGGYICALALGLSLPFSQLCGAHVGAGLWNPRLPRRLRLLLELAANLACAAALAVIAREIYGVAEYAREMGDYIDGFEFSYFPMALGLALGLLLQGVIFLRGLIRLCAPGAKPC